MIELKSWAITVDEKDWRPDKPYKTILEGSIYKHPDFEDGTYVTIISQSNEQNINDSAKNMICVIYPDRNRSDLDWFYEILEIIQK